MLTRRRLLRYSSAFLGLATLAGGARTAVAADPPRQHHRDSPRLAQEATSPVDTWRVAAEQLAEITTSEGERVLTTRTSPIRLPDAPFDFVVVSWVGTPRPGVTDRFLVRARIDEEWTGWYTMALWAEGATSSVRGQRDAFGRVDVDTLVLDQPANALQLRVESEGDGASSLHSLTAVSGTPTERTSPPIETAAWGRDLDVPRRSQAIQPQPYTWQICSPTSLTMVLGYWGTELPVMDVAFAVRDRASGIFGNWPANTAFAASLGYDAWVDRFDSLALAEQDIAAGCPVIASLRWQSGELPGAPLDSTGGHLMVIRGFTGTGDVIVNDPASPSEAVVRRVLPRAAFERVWLRAGGVVYRIRPLTS